MSHTGITQENTTYCKMLLCAWRCLDQSIPKENLRYSVQRRMQRVTCGMKLSKYNLSFHFLHLQWCGIWNIIHLQYRSSSGNLEGKELLWRVLRGGCGGISVH